jgi:hypothetical protein
VLVIFCLFCTFAGAGFGASADAFLLDEEAGGKLASAPSLSSGQSVTGFPWSTSAAMLGEPEGASGSVASSSSDPTANSSLDSSDNYSSFGSKDIRILKA